MGRELFHEQRVNSSEELRGEVPLKRVDALRRRLKGREG